MIKRIQNLLGECALARFSSLFPFNYKSVGLVLILFLSFNNSLLYSQICVDGTGNRIAGTWHSDLYIAGNTTTNSNDLYGWGQNMSVLTNLTASTPVGGGTTSDVYVPSLISSSSYSGVPLEVRGSSPTSSVNVFGLRTTTKFYVFGDGRGNITNWSSFGGTSLSTGDVTSKLPAGVSLSDVASFRISSSAIALLTNSGNVYILSKNSLNILGDKSTSESTSSSAAATSSSINPSSVTNTTQFTIASKPNLSVGDQISLSNGTNSISGTVNTYNISTGVLTINKVSTSGSSSFNTWTLSYNYSWWHQVKLSDGTTPLSGVTKLSVSGSGAMALTSSGRLYYWGDGNPYGSLTTPTSYNYAYDITAATPSGTTISDVLVAGKTNSNLFLLGADGYVYSCGTNDKGILGINNSTTTTYTTSFQKVKKETDGANVSTLNNIKKIDAGNNGDLDILIAMNASGQIFGWGDNNQYGMLGTIKATSGSNTDHFGAIQIFTSATAAYSKVSGGTAASTASPGSGYSDVSVGGHFIIAFYTSGNTSQYWYQGHNTNGSIGYDPDAVVQSGNTFGTQSSIASIYAPTYLNAPAGTSFSCSNAVASINVSSVALASLTTCSGSASPYTTFTVAGTGLTSSINVTAPSGFEVSTSASGSYTSSISLLATSGTVSTTTLYIRLSAGASNGASANISCSSGSVSQQVATPSVTINVCTTPQIAQNSNFSNFTSCIGTTSAAQSFTVSAADLTSNLTVTAPTGFELASSSSGTYSSSIVLTQSSGTVSTTTLWARIKSATLTSTSGNISLASTGATTGTISVTAQVSALPTISVNVIPDVTTSATSFTIPYTGLAGADVYSISTGTAAMPSFSPVVDAAISGSPLSITIPASTQNNYDFILTVKNSTSGCSIQRNFSLVVSDMNPGTTGADQAICFGTIPATFTNLTDASVGGVGSPTYIWQISTTGVSGTYTDIAGATAADYTHPAALTADTYFRRKATIGVSFATAHPIEVLVNALPTIAVSPSSASITTGSSVTLTASGANTYSWTPSTGLSGANTAVVTASPTSTTTYMVTGTNSTTTCSATASVTVSINAALSAGTISVDQTICVGATPATLTSASAATGGTGPITYVWSSSTNGTTYTTISGATSSTYSPGAISVSTYFKRGASTPVDAVIYTSPILITVQSSVGGSITGSAAVCAGTNSTVLILSGQTGSITKWQSALTANFSRTVTDIASTTSSITASNLTATTYYRALVTLGSCSAANSAVASITVNALPVLSVSPSAPSITSGGNVTLTASGASTYSWTPSTGLSATNTAVVTASPTATTTYSVTGTSSSCSSTATVTVTVTAATPADSDGDGVTDTQESIDGTDPNDICSYLVASQTLTPTSAWIIADCDGDGTPNGTDTNPKDPCVHASGATPVTTNSIWRAADCDGDGVTNGKETDDGTDSNEGCSYLVASRTLTPTAAWGLLDCDADGNSNATDPHVDAPEASNDVVTVGNTGTVTINILINDDFLPGPNTTINRQTGMNAGTARGTVTFNPLTGEMTYQRAPFESGLVTMGYRVSYKIGNTDVFSTAFVTIVACDLQDPLADCDGDGEPNGTDLAPTDPCVYESIRQVKANVSDDWKVLDCDGDGVINGTELTDGTSPADACSFKAPSITLAPSAAWLLLDCDADGITNKVEGTQDFDGDGIPNCLDTDSDGDSISDKLETTVDTDKDGKPDYLDLDSDNDGILDSVENRVCTGTGILCDTDADGKPNFRDLDSDADQISDVIEANGSDYNRDGIADGNIDEKGIPTSANKGLTPPDTDRDGKLDPYDVDSDGDGILDYDEEYNEDADFPDCDHDGIINRLDPDECDIFSPQGISPNGDGKNDRLVFKGLYLRKIPNHLSIYNRWGTLVYEMESYDNTFTGTSLPDGTYYYILDFFGKKPTISNYLSVDRTIK
jgi:gliding motility-associated-like protein